MLKFRTLSGRGCWAYGGVPGLIVKRIIMVALLWLLLTGGTVIYCSSGDGTLLRPGDNRRPVANDSFLQTSVTTKLIASMSATDPDGDDLTYRVISGPSIGNLESVDADTGRFVYVPERIGSDSFDFRANDGQLDSNTATVRITVTAQAVKTEADGLKTVLPDPQGAGGMVVLWNKPYGALERIPAERGGETETLLGEVTLVVADRWHAGRLVALKDDRRLMESLDAGNSWREIGQLTLPGPARSAALDRDRLFLAVDSNGCPRASARTGATMAALVVTTLCADKVVVVDNGGAFYLAEGRLVEVATDRSVLGPGVLDVAADPTTRSGLIAAISLDDRIRLQVSNDGGLTWQPERGTSLFEGDPGTVAFHEDFRSDEVALVFERGAVRAFMKRNGSPNSGWSLIEVLSGEFAAVVSCGAKALCALDRNGRQLRPLSGSTTID